MTLAAVMALSLFAASDAGAAPAATSAYAKASVEVLAASSSWIVDYADESCRLLRTFGSEPRKVALGITSYEPRSGFSLVLSGEQFLYREQVRFASLRFGPSSANVELPAIVATMNGLSSVYTSGAIEVGGDRLSIVNGTDDAAITTLTATLPDRPALLLSVGKMDAPMLAMRTCLDDLIRHWGLDPTVQATLSRRVLPANKTKAWFSANDFPSAAINRVQSGAIRYRLLIDSAGAVSDCKVQGGTKLFGYAELGCARLRERARFKPALDAKGKAVASYFTGGVFWEVDRDKRRVSWQS